MDKSFFIGAVQRIFDQLRLIGKYDNKNEKRIS